MNIHYFEPLSRAVARMKQALFHPFSLKKWFIIGFTAWLAGLMDGNGGGGNRGNAMHGDFGDVLNSPYEAWTWLQDHPQWMLAVIFGLVFIFFLIAVLTWLSSRGKFMFVDNIVHDRALVAQPWNEYAGEGNSLFVWRFIFALFSIAAVLGFLYHAWQNVYSLYFGPFDEAVPWVYLIKMIFLFIFIVLVLGYINLLLNEFVVAIMYKQRISASRAWNSLMAIHWPHALQFFLFAILWAVLAVITVILIIIGGLLTCCIGFFILLLPVINAVVLLPISYTFRAFSLEFIAQFGDDYSVFSDEGDELYPPAVG